MRNKLVLQLWLDRRRADDKLVIDFYESLEGDERGKRAVSERFIELMAKTLKEQDVGRQEIESDNGETSESVSEDEMSASQQGTSSVRDVADFQFQ